MCVRSCKFVRFCLLLNKLAWSFVLSFSFEHIATFKQFLFENFGQTVEHEDDEDDDDDERTKGVPTTTKTKKTKTPMTTKQIQRPT